MMFSKIGLFLCALIISFKSFGSDLVDVVFVNDTRGNPFFVQIFEASKTDVSNIGIHSSYDPGNSYKPDRLTYQQAVDYCQKIAMEIPTESEWLAAATNLGQNTNSTLKGDGDPSLANVDSGDSTSTNNINVIKIDAIGTVAMTGNRGEWVEGGSQCGGSYQTRDPNVLKLNSQICRSSNFESRTATVRCVLRESNPNAYNIVTSGKVPGELKTYLEGINFGVGTTSPVNRTTRQESREAPPAPPEILDQETLYDKIIDEFDLDNDVDDFD